MILITGATGVVGSTIARELLASGRKVRVLYRPVNGFGMLRDIEKEIEWIEGDILDPNAVLRAMEGCTKVVHAAALVSFYPADRARMFHTNVEGTKLVVNACLQSGVKKLCHISSVSAIDRMNGQEAVDENEEWTGHELASGYAVSKYEAELEVWRGIEEGLDAVILNPSLVLAKGDWSRSSLQLFGMVKNGFPFYSAGTINLVDARDVASAVILGLERNISGERFILSGAAVSYKDFMDRVALRMHKKGPSYPLPEWVAVWYSHLLGILHKLTGIKNLLTRDVVRSSYSRTVYLNKKSVEKLGVHYHTLDETLDWALG